MTRTIQITAENISKGRVTNRIGGIDYKVAPGHYPVVEVIPAGTKGAGIDWTAFDADGKVRLIPTEYLTGVRGFEAKAERVREYLSANPGAGSVGIGYGAKLNTPGPMGSNGRGEALTIADVLVKRGEAVRKTSDGWHRYYLTGSVIFPLHPSQDPDASPELRGKVRRNRREAEAAA